MPYMEREHAKHVLKKYYILISLLIIVALTLKVARNLFQTFHLHADSSMGFRYWMIARA